MKVTPRFKSKGKPKRRAKEGRDDGYLKWLRTLPCVATKTSEAGVAHHLLMKNLRGAGMKAPDWCALPLRGDIHDHLHHEVPAMRTEEEWFLLRGVPRPDLLAGILWQIAGDTETADLLIRLWRT